MTGRHRNFAALRQAARNRRRRGLVPLLIALTMGLGAVATGVGVGPAAADTASPYRFAGHYESDGAGSWYGSYSGMSGLPDGLAGYCTYPSGGEPDAFVRNGHYELAGALHSNGRDLTTAQLGYALEFYGSSTNDTTATAMYYLVERNLNDDNVYVSSTVMDRVNDIKAAARANAGPWDINLSSAPNGLNPGDSYTEHISIRSAKNSGFAKTIALTYSANADGPSSVRTDDNGNAAFKVTIGDNVQSFHIAARATQVTTIRNYAASDQPKQQSQSVAVAGAGQSVGDDVTGDVTPSDSTGLLAKTDGHGHYIAGAKFSVKDRDGTNIGTFTTQSTPSNIGPLHIGDKYVFTEIAAPAGYYIPDPNTTTVTIQDQTTNLIAIADPVLPTTKVVTQANIGAAPISRGKVLTDSVTVTGDDGEDFTLHSVLYGPVVVPAGTLTCEGITRAQFQAAPQVYDDTINHSGDGGDGNGNGTYKVTGPTALKTGCYGWYQGARFDPSNVTAISYPDAADESSLLYPPNLSVGTQVNVESVSVGRGQQLNDVVTVSGNDGEDGVITGTLYGPVSMADDATDCSTLTLADYQAAAKQTFTAKVDGTVNNGNGNYTVTGPVVTDLGCYGWAESLHVTPSDVTVTSAPTTPHESTLVYAPKPVLATQANYDLTPVGNTLTDTVTVSGNDGEDGTIAATLYGPVSLPGGVTDCSALVLDDYTGAPAQTFTATVDGTVNDGNGDYTVTGPVVTEPGCYGWAETMTLTPSKATASSPPTAPHESTLVTTPKAATQVSEQYGLVGDKVSDTIDVSGVNTTPSPVDANGKPVAVGTLTATTYFMPYASEAQSCDNVTESDWAKFIAARPFGSKDSAQVQQVTFPLTSDGLVKTKPYTVTQIGCLTYGESFQLGLPSDATATPPVVNTNVPIEVSAPGSENEVTSIISPTTSTVMAKATGAKTPETNTKVFFADTATIKGTHGVPVTLHDKLIGPANPVNGKCVGAKYNAKDVAGVYEDVTVTKDGKVTTEAIPVKKVIDQPKCYVGFETLSITAQNGSDRLVPNSAPPLGEVNEMIMAAASRGSGGGGHIDTGLGATKPDSGPNTALIVGGSLLSVLALGGLLMLALRKRRVTA